MLCGQPVSVPDSKIRAGLLPFCSFLDDLENYKMEVIQLWFPINKYRISDFQTIVNPIFEIRNQKSEFRNQNSLRIHKLETRNRKSEIRNQKSKFLKMRNLRLRNRQSEIRNSTCNIQFRYSRFISVCDVNIVKMNRKTLQNFHAGGGYKYVFNSGGNF